MSIVGAGGQVGNFNGIIAYKQRRVEEAAAQGCNTILNFNFLVVMILNFYFLFNLIIITFYI